MYKKRLALALLAGQINSCNSSRQRKLNMRNLLKITASAAVLAVSWQTAAQAVIMDFNHLTVTLPAVSGNRGSNYQEDGFQLDTNGTFISVHVGNAAFTGSVSMYESILNRYISMTKIGGGLFDLDSIDIDVNTFGNLNVPILFSGSLVGGGSVTQSFTPDLVTGSMQTVVFGPGFDSVQNVGFIVNAFINFDNIVFDAPEVITVPEPMTLGLLGVGLAGLGWARRRSFVGA